VLTPGRFAAKGTALGLEPTRTDTASEASHPPALAPSPLRRLAAAFTYRDFRVLWLGAFTSSTGTWIQISAQSWLILTLTGSAFFLGLDGFLGQLPIMLFTLIGGVVADRRDRRSLLLTSQYIQMSAAFVLAALVYFHVVHVWHILALSFVSGCAQAFGGPAYQSLIPSLVRKQDLPNAIALNSIQFNLARATGSLISGVAITTLGMVACFSLNGFSFVAVIFALLSLSVKHIPPVTMQPMLQELKSGLSYVRRQKVLLALTVLAFLTTFLGSPLQTLLPVFAANVFHRGAAQYTVMLAFSGFGSVAGALVVAWLGKYSRMGTATLVVLMVVGLLIAAFAMSRSAPLSYLLLFLGGGALIAVFSSIMSLVQLVAPNEMRGRVMSIFMVAFRGGMPIGNLVAGYVAHRTSAPLAVGINGLLLVGVALYFLVVTPQLRET
jgi:predicted MFS family arabinose efflux permease